MVNWRNSLLWLCLTLCQYETFWGSLLYLNKEKPYLKLEILRPLANSACPLTSLWREFCRKCCICRWLVVIFFLIKNCSDLTNFDLIWLLLLWFNFFWVDFDTISYLQVMWNWDPYAIKEESSFLNVRSKVATIMWFQSVHYKDLSGKKVKIYFLNFYLVKSSENILFF